MGIGNEVQPSGNGIGTNNATDVRVERRRIKLSYEDAQKQANAQYEFYLDIQISHAEANWKVFADYYVDYADIAAEYLERYIDISKSKVRDFEKFCYDLFLDLSQGRKGIKSDECAKIAAKHIENTRDANKLFALTKFFEDKHDEKKADKFYVTLYQLYLNGEGVRKDLDKAAHYITLAIKVNNTPDRRDCLREIYEQQNAALGDKKTDRSYELMIDAKIDGANSDYAEHLKSKEKTREAMKYFVADKNFFEAYNVVNIKSANELDAAIEAFRDGGGGDKRYAESLKLMRSNFATLQRIFAIKEKPMSHAKMAFGYMLGPIWTVYRTMKKLGWEYLLIGLLGTIAFTLIGVFTLGNTIGAIFCMSALLIWMFLMIGYDVNLRNDFREACRLYKKIKDLYIHRLLLKDDVKNVFDKESDEMGEPWSWALILPVLFWLSLTALVGIGLTRPDINENISLPKAEDFTKQLEQPKDILTVEEQQAACKVLSNFYDFVSKKDFRQAYACFDSEFRRAKKYDDWLKEVQDAPKITALDMQVTPEDENLLSIDFIQRAEFEKGKSEDFPTKLFMVREADGWKIINVLEDSSQSETEVQTDNAKSEPSKVETPKVEEKKVETPKVEEKKVETPKVEEKKVETSEKPPDDKAQAIAVLVEFHESITKKEYHRAYDCFSDAYKNRVPYDGWAPGFKTTVSSSALDIKVTDASADTITLNYNLRAVDDPGGTRNFNCNVVMVKTANGWKINATSNKLK